MAVTDLIRDDLKQSGRRMTRLQWLGVSTLMGMFLGFVDTLTVACVLGYLGVEVPAYVGVPTTFSGYFFTGVLVGRLAPPTIGWEAPGGILICVLAFMMGFAGFSGQGPFLLVLHYGVLPSAAVGACYVGLKVGRQGLKPLWHALWHRSKEPNRPSDS